MTHKKKEKPTRNRKTTRLVRERMSQTGETYTAARAHVLASASRLSRIIRDFLRKHCPDKIVLRSVEDNRYPQEGTVSTLDDGGRISSWFTVEWTSAGRFYDRGIEVVLEGRGVYVDKDDNTWFTTDSETMREGEPDLGQYERRTATVYARIPYRNIDSFQEYGDSYYSGPQIFCRFADDGRPYEALFFRLDSQPGDSPIGSVLDPGRRRRARTAVPPSPLRCVERD